MTEWAQAYFTVGKPRLGLLSWQQTGQYYIMGTISENLSLSMNLFPL